MANTTLHSTLGDVIREARVAKSLTLRALAKKLEITPSYLSDIENDRRTPAEEVLQDLSHELDLDFNDLMARAGRLGDQATRYMTRVPAVGVLFRKLSEENAPKEDIEKLSKFAENLTKKRST